MSFQSFGAQSAFVFPSGKKSIPIPSSGYGRPAANTSFAKRLNVAAKRAMDIVISVVALALLWPVFLIIMLLIKIEDPGPAVFRQLRWGQGGRKFTVLKFRTMYVGRCDKTGTKQTVKNDSRVTLVGAFLRKSNIDELPQLVNVLKGEMSLVGPRCHPVGLNAGGILYEELVPSYHRRHALRPGITGLAQINKLRGPTLDKERSRMRIVHDRLYVIKNNVWLDCQIIVLTAIRECWRGTGF
ncbi:sugar transferase [uncultured Maritalea sp.]|jgi:lipopolysaccharide/colanic/teichoic acid biosynthesis glycosyltransferase|uniref:sugar transferase n=1 Tax=uncultured Maritalea sp. TaxID=757249 RepID=UPI0026059027|nr:sugar transferase [uncultured Maritalea sp.]